MYSGNSSVVNFLMRFPVLIPVAVAVPIVTAVLPKEAPPAPVVQAPVVVAPPVAVPVPVAPPTPAPVIAPAPTPRTLPPVEALCPPSNKLTPAELAKLSTRERATLAVRGCIKG